MKVLVLVAWLAGVVVARGAEATLAWDLPVTNTDGSPLTALVATDIYFAPAVAQVTGWTTNWGWRVMTGVQLSTIGPTNSVRFPSSTLAPTNGQWQSGTVTNLTAGIYGWWGRAVVVGGGQSEDCERVYAPAGKPSTIKLRK